jgi:hypothetical protein
MIEISFVKMFGKDKEYFSKLGEIPYSVPTRQQGKCSSRVNTFALKKLKCIQE